MEILECTDNLIIQKNIDVKKNEVSIKSVSRKKMKSVRFNDLDFRTVDSSKIFKNKPSSLKRPE